MNPFSWATDILVKWMGHKQKMIGLYLTSTSGLFCLEICQSGALLIKGSLYRMMRKICPQKPGLDSRPCFMIRLIIEPRFVLRSKKIQTHLPVCMKDEKTSTNGVEPLQLFSQHPNRLFSPLVSGTLVTIIYRDDDLGYLVFRSNIQAPIWYTKSHMSNCLDLIFKPKSGTYVYNI